MTFLGLIRECECANPSLIWRGTFTKSEICLGGEANLEEHLQVNYNELLET